MNKTMESLYLITAALAIADGIIPLPYSRDVLQEWALPYSRDVLQEWALPFT
jgi:hypothetical protein